MDSTPRALVSGSMRQYGDRAIAEAIEGAFINAELARQIQEYKRKADMWDLHMELKRMKHQAMLSEIEHRHSVKPSFVSRLLSRIR